MGLTQWFNYVYFKLFKQYYINYIFKLITLLERFFPVGEPKNYTLLNVLFTAHFQLCAVKKSMRKCFSVEGHIGDLDLTLSLLNLFTCWAL